MLCFNLFHKQYSEALCFYSLEPLQALEFRTLFNIKVDLNQTRNVIIISVTLTIGIGGAVLTWGNFTISGIGLSALVGVILNLILPQTKVEKTEEEKEA